MTKWFDTDHGRVSLTTGINDDYKGYQELKIIPNPANGWGVSLQLPLSTVISDDVVKTFASEAITFL